MEGHCHKEKLVDRAISGLECCCRHSGCVSRVLLLKHSWVSIHFLTSSTWCFSSTHFLGNVKTWHVVQTILNIQLYCVYSTCFSTFPGLSFINILFLFCIDPNSTNLSWTTYCYLHTYKTLFFTFLTMTEIRQNNLYFKPLHNIVYPCRIQALWELRWLMGQKRAPMTSPLRSKWTCAAGGSVGSEPLLGC